MASALALTACGGDTTSEAAGPKAPPVIEIGRENVVEVTLQEITRRSARLGRAQGRTRGDGPSRDWRRHPAGLSARRRIGRCRHAAGPDRGPAGAGRLRLVPVAAALGRAELGVGAEGSDPHREPGQGRGARRARRRAGAQRRDPGQGRGRRRAVARRLGPQGARGSDRQGADRRHRVEAPRQRRRRRQPGRRALHDHRSVEHAPRGVGAVGADCGHPGRRHRSPSRSAAIPRQRFEGRIERVSPSADPATRQVPIFVTIPNKQRRLVAGLFAEGRVAQASKTGLVVPQIAVNENGSSAVGLEGAGRQGASASKSPSACATSRPSGWRSPRAWSPATCCWSARPRA